MITSGWTDAQQTIVNKNVVSHASGYGILTCMCMQNVIKIYHVVQEL